MSPHLLTNLFSLSKKRRLYLSLLIINALVATGGVSAQSTTVVLPGNGSYIQKNAPQGASRSQRGFYLLTPKEIQASGLANGMPVTSIGFTIGAAQDSTTRGSFKVYLQNTSDTVSRTDTAWTTVTGISGTSYSVTSLVPGNYEWQVRTSCATPSAFSPVIGFSNNSLGSCNPPTNLTTTNITASSATLNWVAPASNATKYYVEYKNQDSTTWIRDSTTQLSYTASGLKPNKFYQWQVKTVCSGDTSTTVGGTFQTNNAVSAACGTPGNLTIASITTSSALASWSAVTGASYYTIQYRRKGTTQFLGVSAFSNAYTIAGLTAGTTYEWRVRSVCTDSTGVFSSGTDFTTTGTTTCYAPNDLSTNAITDSSAVFAWSAATGAATYEVRYRLKEAISWTNAATPMTLVHSDSLTIPNITGPYNVSFTGGSAFSYSGQGIYVAWEYSNSTGRLSSANTSLGTTAGTTIKGSAGQDSAKLVLSLAGISKNNASALPNTLTSTDQRPETRFGSSSLKDSVEVVAVYALGNTAPSFSADSISALVKNNSGASHTYAVTLTVKEQKTNAVRYTTTQNVSVNANASQVVIFTGWSPTQIETDSLLVSIPAQSNENVVRNNSNFYLQNVTRSVVSYDDGSNAITQAGNDTLPILLLNRYHMNGCGKINSVKVYLSSSAKGRSVYAVALNAAHAVIAQSSSFTPDSTQINNYHTFYFPTQTSLKDADYYVGLAQPGGKPGYSPVGVQWEGANPRSNSYFRAKLNGDSLTAQPQPGRLMIEAELVSGGAVAAITGSLSLCPSSTTTLTAASADVRFADSVIRFSSQSSNVLYSANEALGTTDVFPNYGINPNAWTSATADGRREYLVLRFPNAAPANFIDIYETLNPGAVDTVWVKNPGTSAYDMVYSGTATATPGVARRNRINFTLTSYNVSEVRIALNSPAVPGYNAIDAVGIGRLTTPGTFSSYTWTPGGETTQTKTVSAGGVYKLAVVDGNGCASSDSVTVIASTQVTPTITATRPTTFCQGDSTILKSSQKGGNTWSTGATTDSIIVKTAGSYTVTYNDGTSCGTRTSAATAISVNSLPTPHVTGNTPFCSGGSATLDAGTFNGYLWSTGATTKTIAVWTQGTYWARVTDANGCKAADTITTSVGSALSPTIAGTLAFCSGSSTTLDAGTGYRTYSWSTGATTQTITVTTAGTFTVTVTGTNGCSGSTSVTTSLYAKPTPSITGTLGFCPGSSTTLTANAGYTGYAWSTGATTQSISNVNAAGSYTVTVTDTHNCSASKSVIVNQYAAPSPVISGALTFCGGSATTLDAGSSYSAYSWSTGATTQAITVSTVGTFTVNVTDANGCTGSTSAITTQDGSIPATPGPISSNTNNTSLCGTTGNVYSIAPVTNASYYTWTVPDGATITSGQNTTSITVGYSSTFKTGDIVVAAANSCGQSSSLNPSKLTVQGIPATPLAINGQATGLCTAAGVVYSISSVAGASSYSWTVPAGATITSGQNTTSITVTFGIAFTSGNICVTANNVCGSSAPACKAVSNVPLLSGGITGPTTVCSKQSGVVYSVAAASGATSYTWTVPSLASFTMAPGGNSITVKFGTKGGSVTVKANNACGSSVVKTLTVSMGSCAVTSISAKEANLLQAEITAVRNLRATVLPNPSASEFTIVTESSKGGPLNMRITDALGRLVEVKTNVPANGAVRIGQGYRPGSYYVEVRQGTERRTLQLMKLPQ